jgi:hypothetical protein
VAFQTVALRIYLCFVAAGVAIGSMGSIVFVGKHIHV